MMTALTVLFALASPTPVCFPVRDNQIFGRDLAAAAQALDQFPPDLSLGYAPLAGTKRVLSVEFLRNFAQAHKIPMEITADVCFVRAMVPLAPEAIQEAMQAAWKESSRESDSIRIDVSKWGPETVPQGSLVFPMTGLTRTQGTFQGEALWRGYVSYGGTHRVAIWARARITGAATRVIAVSVLPGGKPIRGEQVRLESCDACAPDSHAAQRLNDVIGLVPRTAIQPGGPVLKNQLRPIPEVSGGDLVTVQVDAGAAHLLLEGRAQGSAATGEKVRVRNLSSGKDFQATVVSRGIVRVEQ